MKRTASTGRPRGRPRKNQQEQKTNKLALATNDEVDAANALLQVVQHRGEVPAELPLCTDHRRPMAAQLPKDELERVALSTLESIYAAFDKYVKGSPALAEVIQSSIRKDPRTQELGATKRDLDELRKGCFAQGTRFDAFAKELDLVREVLRQQGEVTPKEEAVRSQLDLFTTRLEQHIKSIDTAIAAQRALDERTAKRARSDDLSMKAFESRLAVLEEKARQ